MHLPPQSPISQTYVAICGNIVIHPSVAIAPGVLLQADRDSQLTIAAGVCIGMGAILHAYQGTLAIEAEVVIGSRALILGSGTIGTGACIGQAATVFETSLEPHQVVLAGKVMGDRSRSLPQFESDSSHPQSSFDQSSFDQSSFDQDVQVDVQADLWDEPTNQPSHPAPSPSIGNSGTKHPTDDPNDSTKQTSESDATESHATEDTSPLKSQRIIYGLAYFEELMQSLFPHRRALHPPPQDNSSPIRDTGGKI